MLGVVSVSRIQGSGPGQSLAVGHGDAEAGWGPTPRKHPKVTWTPCVLVEGLSNLLPQAPAVLGCLCSVPLLGVEGLLENLGVFSGRCTGGSLPLRVDFIHRVEFGEVSVHWFIPRGDREIGVLRNVEAPTRPRLECRREPGLT